MESMLVSTFSKKYPTEYTKIQTLVDEVFKTGEDTGIKNFGGFFAEIEQSLRTGHWYMYIYSACEEHAGGLIFCTPTKFRVEMDALGFNMKARDNMMAARRR